MTDQTDDPASSGRLSKLAALCDRDRPGPQSDTLHCEAHAAPNLVQKLENINANAIVFNDSLHKDTLVVLAPALSRRGCRVAVHTRTYPQP